MYFYFVDMLIEYGSITKVKCMSQFYTTTCCPPKEKIKTITLLLSRDKDHAIAAKPKREQWLRHSFVSSQSAKIPHCLSY